MFHCEQRQFESAGDSNLVKNVGQVMLDGPLTDRKLLPRLSIRIASGDFCDDLHLSRRKPVLLLCEGVLQGKRCAKCFQKNRHAAIFKAVLTIITRRMVFPHIAGAAVFRKDALSAKTEGFTIERLSIAPRASQWSVAGRTSHIEIQRHRLLAQSKIDKENVRFSNCRVDYGST